MKKIKFSVIVLMLLVYSNSHAELYTCSIKNVSKLNHNGYFVSHGWKANYLNREFTIDRESGKIVNTTALKERLSNFDAEHEPIIISRSKNSAALKVFTEFKDNSSYSLFHMDDPDSENIKKPYFYHTSIGMILSGTCKINSSNN